MEKNALSVNLFGGPGVGKSTTAAGVFSLLKLHGLETELVTEFAKDLVWEERHKTFEDQNYLFGKQHHRMWRIRDKVDVMVNDSPLLLSVVYRPDTLGESFVNHVVDTFKSFKNLNIVLKRVKKYNPNGRNETEYQARTVDEKIKAALAQYELPWIEVPGNHEGLNSIVNILLEKFNKTPKFELTSK